MYTTQKAYARAHLAYFSPFRCHDLTLSAGGWCGPCGCNFATPQHGPPKQRTRRTFQGDYLACQDVKNDDDDTTHRRREGQNPIKRRCTLIAQRPFNFVGSPPFELHMFIYKCVWAWRGSSPVPRGDFARPPAPRGSFALKGVRDETFKIHTQTNQSNNNLSHLNSQIIIHPIYLQRFPELCNTIILFANFEPIIHDIWPGN